MEDISELILKNLVINENYCRKVAPFLKIEYFEGKSKVVFKLIVDFVSKYNSLPNCSSLEYEFENLPKQPENAQEVHSFIKQVFEVTEDDKATDEKWLHETTEKWCKDRAIYLGVIKSIEIIDGKNTKYSPGAIPDILQRALSVSFDKNVGHDYVENATDRFNFYHTDEARIPFDLQMLNDITGGGVPNKTLNILMSGTGVGKTLAMCHLASSYLSQGKNVLYVTLEMAEEKIAERIDANLFDVNIQDLLHLTKDEFTQKVKDIKSKTHGRLVIKEYPTASAHVGHFRALIDELKLKKDFVPHAIFIDYLNICASSRMKGLGGSVNTYSYIKAIAEEVRGFSIENDVPIWSATQLNREGYKSSDVDLTNTSESFGLPATADLMLALISTEELEELDQILVKQLKNRYNDIAKNRRFVLGIDRPKMRLYDAEDSAQDDIMPEINEYTQGHKSEIDYSDFQV